jgi:hypothetical protein
LAYRRGRFRRPAIQFEIRPARFGIRIGAATEEESKPPADDAPIKELVAYWFNAQNVSGAPNALKPSDRVSQRLLEACEDRPELLFHSILVSARIDARRRVFVSPLERSLK